MKPPKPNPAHQKQIAEKWNAAHKPGTAVVVTKDDGSKAHTTTESNAHVIGGHTAVIFLHGITGSYRLDRVVADQPATTKA